MKSPIASLPKHDLFLQYAVWIGHSGTAEVADQAATMVITFTGVPGQDVSSPYGRIRMVDLACGLADPGNQNANPLFVNYVSAGKQSNDYHLQSGSPAIAAGTNLTTVAAGDSGSGTSLVVTDAAYFPGWLRPLQRIFHGVWGLHRGRNGLEPRLCHGGQLRNQHANAGQFHQPFGGGGRVSL